jgi:hypothetical protein
MRRGAFFLAALLFIAGAGTPAASAQTDAVAVARALIAAENAHDVAAAVGFFGPAAIVNLPTGALVGRAEIEQWQRELAAGNFRAEITPPVAVTPEVVTFSGTVALDSFRRLGISPLDASWELIIQLGRVTIFNFSFTPAATARLQGAIANAGGGGTTGSGAGAGGGAPAASGGGGSGVQNTPATASSGRALALTGVDPGLAGVASGMIALGMLLLLATGHGVARRAPSEIA